MHLTKVLQIFGFRLSLSLDTTCFTPDSSARHAVLPCAALQVRHFMVLSLSHKVETNVLSIVVFFKLRSLVVHFGGLLQGHRWQSFTRISGPMHNDWTLRGWPWMTIVMGLPKIDWSLFHGNNPYLEKGMMIAGLPYLILFKEAPIDHGIKPPILENSMGSHARCHRDDCHGGTLGLARRGCGKTETPRQWSSDPQRK